MNSGYYKIKTSWNHKSKAERDHRVPVGYMLVRDLLSIKLFLQLKSPVALIVKKKEKKFFEINYWMLLKSVVTAKLTWNI